MKHIKLNSVETLPHDGEIILLFLKDGTICDAWFSSVEPVTTARDDAEYDWICCDDKFTVDGHDTHLIEGWLPLNYFEGFA